MPDAAELQIVIGARVDNAVAGVDKLLGSLTKATAVAATIPGTFAKASAGINQLTPIASKAGESVHKIATSLHEVSQSVVTETGLITKGVDKVGTSVTAIGAGFGAKWQPIVDGAVKAENALENTNTAAIQLKSNIQQFGGGVISFDVQGVKEAIKDTNTLSISVSKAVSAISTIPATKIVIAGAPEIQKTITDVNVLSTALNKLGTGGIATIAPEATKAAASVSKITGALTTASGSTVAATSKITTAYDQMEASVNAIAATFSTKWNPVIAGAIAAATALKDTNTAALNLRNNISNFGGGVIKLDVQGVKQAIQDTDKFSVSVIRAGEAIRTIPVTKINIAGSAEIVKTITDVEKLIADLTQLGFGGSASVKQLTTALQTLKTASVAPVDAAALSAYDVAVLKVSDDIARLKNIAQEGGLISFNVQGIEKAILDTGKLTTGLVATGSAIKAIPPLNIGLTGAPQVLKTVADIELLIADLNKLGLGGSASVIKLTQALDLLKVASVNTVDPGKLAIYDAAIQDVTQDVIRLKAVTETGTGVIKLDIQGVEQAIQNTDRLTVGVLKATDAIRSIPATKITIAGSPEIIKTISDVDLLIAELTRLGEGGSASVSKLTNTLQLLKTSAVGTVDATQLEAYDAAVIQVTNDILKFKNVTDASGRVIHFNVLSVEDAINDVNSLGSSLINTGNIIETIPPLNLSVTGAPQIIKTTADIELLIADLNKLGLGGSAAVTQLTNALGVLKTASVNAVDLKQVPVFDAAIQDVTIDIVKLKSLLQTESVLRLDTAGLEKVIQDTNSLTTGLIKAGNAIETIPPLQIDLVGGPQVLKTIADVNLLVADLTKLGTSGSASVAQLTQALQILKAASANTVDIQAMALYDEAIEKVTNQITQLKNVSEFGGGVLKFDINTAAIKAAINDVTKFSLLSTAPVQLRITTDAQAALVGLEHLGVEIKELSINGITSINQLNAALNTLRAASAGATNTTEIAKYNNAISKLTAESARLQTVSSTAGKSIANVSKTSATAGTAIGGISKGSNTATLALTNLGRVAQDLPFGFIGIANNLNPLLESFQRLQEESKKTGTSISSLLTASLKGAGGLGIALSVVSAALTIFSLGMGAWTRGFGAAKKEAEDAGEAVDVFAEATKKAVSEVTREVKEVELAFLVLRRQNTTYAEKEAAIKKLNEISPTYFGGLKIEKGLINDLAGAYTNYVNNLLASVKSKTSENQLEIFNDKLVKNATKLDEVNQRFSNTQTFGGLLNLNRVNELLNQSVRTHEDILELTRLTGKSEVQIKTDLQQRNGLLVTQTKLLDNIETITNNIKTPTIAPSSGTPDKIDKVSEVLQKLIIARAALAADPLVAIDEKPLAELKLIQSAIEKLQELKASPEIILGLKAEIGIGQGFQKIDESTGAVVKDLDTLLRKVIFKGIDDFKKNLPPPIPIPVPVEIIPEIKFSTAKETDEAIANAKKEVSIIQKRIQLAMSGMKVVTSQGIATTVENLNDSEVFANFDKLDARVVGTAKLLTNVLGPAFDSLANGGNVFQAIGQSLGQMVIKMAAAVVQAAILSVILNSIFPGSTSIPSFGALFSALAGIPKFETGGIATSATLGIFGERGPEAIMPLDRLKDFMPGQQAMQPIVLETRLSGSDIWLSQRRTEAKRGRTF